MSYKVITTPSNTQNETMHVLSCRVKNIIRDKVATFIQCEQLTNSVSSHVSDRQVIKLIVQMCCIKLQQDTTNKSSYSS